MEIKPIVMLLTPIAFISFLCCAEDKLPCSNDPEDLSRYKESAGRYISEEDLDTIVEKYIVENAKIDEATIELIDQANFNGKGFCFDDSFIVNPDPGNITLHLENKTVSDILNAVCNESGEYYWDVQYGVVNILAKGNGENTLLDITVPDIDKDCYTLRYLNGLCSWQRKKRRTFGYSFEGVTLLGRNMDYRFPVELRKPTFRQVLNCFIKQHKLSNWYVIPAKGGEYENSFRIIIF